MDLSLEFPDMYHDQSGSSRLATKTCRLEGNCHLTSYVRVGFSGCVSPKGKLILNFIWSAGQRFDTMDLSSSGRFSYTMYKTQVHVA